MFERLKAIRTIAQRALQTNAQQLRCGLVLRTSGEEGIDFTTVDNVVFQKTTAWGKAPVKVLTMPRVIPHVRSRFPENPLSH